MGWHAPCINDCVGRRGRAYVGYFLLREADKPIPLQLHSNIRQPCFEKKTLHVVKFLIGDSRVVNWIVGTYKMLVLAIALILAVLPIATNLYLGSRQK